MEKSGCVEVEVFQLFPKQAWHVSENENAPPERGHVFYRAEREGLPAVVPLRTSNKHKVRTRCVRILYSRLLTRASTHRRPKYKMPLIGAPCSFLRRERDSNPRTCDSQRFSRPPHSTALPSLRGKSKGFHFCNKKILRIIQPGK